MIVRAIFVIPELIGTKEFVKAGFDRFKHYFSTDIDRTPISVSGLKECILSNASQSDIFKMLLKIFLPE